MRQTIIVYIGLIIVLFLADYFKLNAWIHPRKWTIVAFFGMMSYLLHTLVGFGMRNNREKFIEFYIGSVAARFFLVLIFIGIMLYLRVENPNLFVLNFFALYLFFTIFEITNIVRKLRRFS